MGDDHDVKIAVLDEQMKNAHKRIDETNDNMKSGFEAARKRQNWFFTAVGGTAITAVVTIAAKFVGLK